MPNVNINPPDPDLPAAKTVGEQVNAVIGYFLGQIEKLNKEVELLSNREHESTESVQRRVGKLNLEIDDLSAKVDDVLARLDEIGDPGSVPEPPDAPEDPVDPSPDDDPVDTGPDVDEDEEDTVPAKPKPSGASVFTNWERELGSNYQTLGEDVDINQVRTMIEQGDDNLVIRGERRFGKTIRAKVSGSRVIVFADQRAGVEVNKGYDGFVWNTQHADRLWLIGMACKHKGRAGGTVGFHARLANKTGRKMEDVLFEECFARGFDTNFRTVDDYANANAVRSGRIFARLRHCVGYEAVSDDSHSINWRFEGLAKGSGAEYCVFDHAGFGWGDKRTDTINNGTKPLCNKRSHNVYGSPHSQPVSVVNTWMTNPAAECFQLRGGGLIQDCVGAWFGMAGWVGIEGGVIDSLFMDQLDIYPHETKFIGEEAIRKYARKGGRGHGVQGFDNTGGLSIRNNMLARRRGAMKRYPAINANGKVDLQSNTVMNWHQDGGANNFRVNGKLVTGNGNRTIDGSGPPPVSSDEVIDLVDRPYRTWSSMYEAKTRISHAHSLFVR